MSLLGTFPDSQKIPGCMAQLFCQTKKTIWNIFKMYQFMKYTSEFSIALHVFYIRHWKNGIVNVYILNTPHLISIVWILSSFTTCPSEKYKNKTYVLFLVYSVLTSITPVAKSAKTTCSVTFWTSHCHSSVPPRHVFETSNRKWQLCKMWRGN